MKRGIQMAKGLIGSFVFSKTASGNLIGEFINNGKITKVSTESANLVESMSGFSGEYQTSWMENNKPKFARLIIEQRNDTYELNWYLSTKEVHKGRGFIHGEFLVGYYYGVK